MGWLFAVALGLQERRLRAVVAALGPIALGHALAIGLAAVAVGVLGLVIPQRLLLALGGAALLGFAAYKVATRFRHPRWVGMRVGPRELVAVVVPDGVGARRGADAGAGAGRAAGRGRRRARWPTPSTSGTRGTSRPPASDALLPALAAVGLHSAAMLAVAGVIAVVVYQKVGVEVLRRAWVNLDLIWVGALVVTGGIALGLGLWPSWLGDYPDVQWTAIDTARSPVRQVHEQEREAPLLAPCSPLAGCEGRVRRRGQRPVTTTCQQTMRPRSYLPQVPFAARS